MTEEEENLDDPSTNINHTMTSLSELVIKPFTIKLSPDNTEESKTDLNDRTDDHPVEEEEKITEKIRGLYDTLPTAFDVSSLDQQYSQKI